MKPENIVLAALILLGLSPADSTLVAISARLQAASEDVTPLSLIRFLFINLRDIAAYCYMCRVFRGLCAWHTGEPRKSR